MKLRNCIASNPSIKDWQHVHQLERDAIKVLLQQNPSESVQSQACALVDKMQDLSGVKLTSEFDSYRLQSADAAPSSSSTGKTPGDGMVTLSCNERVFSSYLFKPFKKLFASFSLLVPAQTMIRIREYDQSGSLVNTQDLLKEHGFEVGCHVSRKDGILAKIQTFEGGTSMVVLVMDDAKGGKVVKVDAASFLKGQWTKYQHKALPQYMENWWEPSCFDHKDSIVSYVKGKIALELRQATICSCKPSALLIRCKPGKGVIAALKFGKGQLKLTNRVDAGKGGDGAVLVTTVGGMEFYLCQSTGITVPFWHVASVADAAMANMEIVNMPAKKQ